MKPELTKEQEISFKFVVNQTMRKMRISEKEATKRVKALLSSGIMDEGSYNDRWTQLRMENFLRFDLNKLDYESIFKHTLAFTELISMYDKREGRKLGNVLKGLASNEGDMSEAKVQIELFDKFFAKHIWNYFPGVTKYGV